MKMKGYIQGTDFIVIENLFKDAIEKAYNNDIWNTYINLWLSRSKTA